MPRTWFWGTSKWAISAALLGGRVSRIAGHVLVFGLLLHRGFEQMSLCQASWDGYSVCSGLFWAERWWSVGVMAADKSASWLGLYPPVMLWKISFLFIIDRSIDFCVAQMWLGCFFFLPSFASWSAISFPLMPVCVGVHWRTIQVVRARVLLFSMSFFCIVSGPPDMKACRADSESVRKTAFLGFSSHEMIVSVAFSSARTSVL